MKSTKNNIEAEVILEFEKIKPAITRLLQSESNNKDLILRLGKSSSENSNEVTSYSMDNMRDYFGMSKENAHDALKDVEDTAMLLCRFMRLYRRTSSSVRFKGAFGRV